MMLNKKVLEMAVRDAAYGVTVVSKNYDLDRYDLDRQCENLKKTLEKAGVSLLDYINYESKRGYFSTAALESKMIESRQDVNIREKQQVQEKSMEKGMTFKMRGLDLEM